MAQSGYFFCAGVSSCVTELNLIAKWLAKPPNYVAPHTEVSLFTSLRTLDLTVEQSDVAWVVRLIDRIRSERMEEISINHLVKDGTPTTKIVDWYKESRLDNLLSARQFQKLTHLEITIYANSVVDERVGQRWGEVLGDRCFRQCRDRGILDIKAKLCRYPPDFSLDLLLTMSNLQATRTIGTAVATVVRVQSESGDTEYSGQYRNGVI